MRIDAKYLNNLQCVLIGGNQNSVSCWSAVIRDAVIKQDAACRRICDATTYQQCPLSILPVKNKNVKNDRVWCCLTAGRVPVSYCTSAHVSMGDLCKVNGHCQQFNSIDYSLSS
ncbi:hypothetical protein FKM82_002306 [Ascaphus truei]